MPGQIATEISLPLGLQQICCVAAERFRRWYRCFELRIYTTAGESAIIHHPSSIIHHHDKLGSWGQEIRLWRWGEFETTPMMEVSMAMGVPQMDGLKSKIPLRLMFCGYPHFRKAPYAPSRTLSLLPFSAQMDQTDPCPNVAVLLK